MSIPPDALGPEFAEIVALLPAGWPLNMEAFEDERNYWPVRLLNQLARYPHENQTFFDAHGISDIIDPHRPNVALLS